LNKRFGVSLVGEGGEYEILVLDAPIFRKRLRILEAEKVWEGQSGYFLVKKAVLEAKNG
jgi:diphthine-ammonia ligase